MRDTIKSWSVHSFHSDIKIYRADRADSEILKRNINKVVNVKVHDPDFPKAVSTFPMKVKEYLGYDDTHESMIPDEQKNWSKGQNKLVPSRFIFEVEAYQEPSVWGKFI